MRRVVRGVPMQLVLTTLLAAVFATATPATTIKLKKPDFTLPPDVMKAAPAGVTPEKVYVGSDNCFYAQVSGRWQRFYCIG